MTDDAPWMIVMTQSGQEHLARVCLEGEGYEVFLPVSLAWMKRGRHGISIRGACHRAPLMSRYLFARHPAGERHYVRDVPGCAVALYRDGRYLAVPHAVIEAMRGREAIGLVPPPPPPGPARGDLVTIAGGPFAGFRAMVDAVGTDELRVWVKTLSGHEVGVTLARAGVQQDA